eukprot:TRINITY_DN11317_c0_g2_i20.p1 TRINITY_DN11317_c0_g2~~TRINITY_DN11317_c0_g2_i20.p1  ORF type:complete len:826 (+),score=192.50 TRINITY_DN11317_c0_g2_i20:2-2479(+)
MIQRVDCCLNAMFGMATIILILSATISIAGGSGSDDTALVAMEQTPILIHTLDGMMYAFNPVSGQLMWSHSCDYVVSGDPKLAIPGQDKPNFIPDATNGELFVVFPRQGTLRKVTTTLTELAAGHPRVSEDGLLYIGSKRSSLVVLDMATGQPLNTSNEADDKVRMGSTHGLGPQVVLLARSEYQLIIKDQQTQELLFNMTLATYSSNSIESDFADVAPDSSLAQSTLVAMDNRLTVHSKAHEPWRMGFPSQVVNVFSLDNHGQLVKMSLRRLPAQVDASMLVADSYQIRKTAGRDDGDTSTALTMIDEDADVLHEPYLTPSQLCSVDGDTDECHSSNALVVASDDPYELYVDDDESIAADFSSVLTPLLVTTVSLVTAVMAVLVTAFIMRQQTPPQPSPPAEVPLLPPTLIKDDPPASQPQFPKRLNKLEMYETVLGRGSHGTVVYKGSFESHPVAVKRVLKAYDDIAMREVKILRNSDRHPNVIRYYCLEEDANFLYIGLELCIATLTELIDGPKVTTGGTHLGAMADGEKLASMSRHAISRSILDGLAFLHKLEIIHRDIKPQNVLITADYNIVISDLGLGRLVDAAHNSTTSTGTLGWLAPEVIQDSKTASYASDAFSVGCVIHYVCLGLHPFGQYYERDSNIRKGSPNLTAVKDSRLRHLVSKLIQRDADRRPSIAQALNHPWFWDGNKTLSFLLAVSDRLEKEDRNHAYVTALEAGSARLFGSDWRTHLSEQLLVDLRRFRKYDWTSVLDLLRALRNKKHHYQELDASLKAEFGDTADTFLRYFTSRIPGLVMHIYQAVQKSGLSNETAFHNMYFSAST